MELPELPPMRMTIAGDDPDAGHWYDADQMRDALLACVEHMEWSTPQGKAACEAARAVLAVRPGAAPSEPVAEWQWRQWWNGDGGEPMGWGDWQKVKPRNRLQTLGEAVQEMRDYIARGYRYELRALYAASSEPPGEIPDNELPGMWERADFEGGQDEVRGPDWKRPGAAAPEPASVPPEVLRALERMEKPLHESRLSGVTAQEDARCMKVIGDFIRSRGGAAAPVAWRYRLQGAGPCWFLSNDDPSKWGPNHQGVYDVRPLIDPTTEGESHVR